MDECNTINTAPERLACLAQETRITDLSDRVTELEKSVDQLTSSVAGKIIDTAPAWLSLAAAAIAVAISILGLLILWRVFRNRDLEVTEATFDVGGNTITMKKAAQKINQLLSDIQDHVITQTAQQRRTIAKMSAAGGTASVAQLMGRDDTFAADPAPKEEPFKLQIMWVSDNTDTLIFEQEVLKKMGNDLHTVTSNAEAIERLRDRAPCDLVVSDIYREDEDPEAGLRLYQALNNGILEKEYHNNPHLIKIGTGLKFAIYSWPHRVQKYQHYLDGNDDAIITADFAYLQTRVAWLQRERKKAAGHNP